ncbi:AAA family ATPase [Pedobacter psychroterrae]|uniref:DNA sulfur modification protein DndD n=1 Tax=Pedobacter psychroterrae TaxID=2530453 RepID=A0A4R0NMT1_9SPHI|nr:AAA family ATPase [Pedobacter psychroterrae]TCD01228.1 hypothetical protein EZ437_10755 [Pedobacter psychroterrae]
MKFDKLKLQNFSSYYGDAPTFDFRVEKEKPIVVLIGDTGFGKTSIFDALNWALYGQEYEEELPKLRRGRHIIDYVNEKALKEAAEKGVSVCMLCTLDFSHNMRKYYITQSLTVKPKKKGAELIVEETGRTTKLCEYTPSGDVDVIPYSKTFLDDILPGNVKGYFLFDGDRIYNLASPGSSAEVRDAIYKVVDLEIVKKAEEHLKEIAAEYSREARKLSHGELAVVEERHLEETKIQEDCKRTIQTNQNEKRALDDQIKALEAKLVNLPESEKLQNEKNIRGEGLETILVEQQKIKLLIKDIIPKAAYKLSTEPVENLIGIINDKRKKGEIPKHISETLINDLLNMGRCICDTEFEENSKIHNALQERLLSEKGKSQQEQEVLELLYNLQTLQQTIITANQELSEYEDNLIEQENKEKKERLRIAEIDKELKTLPQENIKLITEQLSIRRDKRDECIRKDQETKDSLKICEDKLKEIDKQRKELGKKEKEVAVLQQKNELAQQASLEIERLYNDFAEDSRKEVEKFTIEEFRKFVFSSSGYHVGLSKEYDLQVLDSNGNPALQRLSMGQSQCLSLAFILAISKVSQKHPPLVIDMPFSRLSKHVDAAVATRLPHLAEQVILFLIPDKEWNDVTQEHLGNYCSHIYELDFDPNERITNWTKIN